MKQIDNRGSNFYVALYWAEELAAKDAAWAPLAQVTGWLMLIANYKSFVSIDERLSAGIER